MLLLAYGWIVIADPGIATLQFVQFDEPIDESTAK